jgi:hypothetical protein
VELGKHYAERLGESIRAAPGEARVCAGEGDKASTVPPAKIDAGKTGQLSFGLVYGCA